MTRLRTSDVGLDGIDRPEDVADGSIVSVFRVPPESAGMRLDVFLQGELKRTSRTRTQVIIGNSAYDIRGKRLRANHRVRAEEHVLLWRPPWDEEPVPTDDLDTKASWIAGHAPAKKRTGLSPCRVSSVG